MNPIRTLPLALAAALALALPGTARAEITEADIAIVEDTDGTIMESVTAPDTYLAKVACAFYKKYPDAFDGIFVFSAIPLNFLTNVQQGWPVQQRSKGIGRLLYNNASKFCSKQQRLRQAVKMGDLKQLPDNPDNPYTGIPGYGLSGIELMGHEFGHQWLASITYKDTSGVEHCALRGWEQMGEPQPGSEQCDGLDKGSYNQHWSYYMDSRSVMYGSSIDDLGGGSFKIRLTDRFGFSPLDQYLMGLRTAGGVPPFFYVNNPDGSVGMGSGALPSTWAQEAEFTGVRVDVTIADVIRQNGERDPPLEKCHWKGAMIVVTDKTYWATPAVLKEMVAYAKAWEAYYDWATDGRGSFDLTLDGRGYGTAGCPSGLTPPPDPGPEPVPEPVPDAVEPEDPGPGPQDDGPLPPDWSGIDFGGGADTAGPADLPPAEGTADAAADAPRDGAGEAGGGEIPAGGTCVPGDRKCDGDNVMQCTADGRAWGFLSSCPASGLRCIDDGVCGTASKKGGGCASAPAPSPALPAAGLLLAMLALLALRRRA